MQLTKTAYNALKAQKPFNYAITAKKDGKKAKNESDADTLIIDVDGYIGEDFWAWLEGREENTIERFKNALRGTSAAKIILNINSPGGDLNHGLVIMEMLQSKRTEVVTNLMGFNASAATAVALGGTKRRMSKNGFMLIHRAMYGYCGYFNQNTTEAWTEDLKTMDNRLIKMYAENGKISESDVATLMDAGEGYGKWIDAEQALKYGFIDEIYDPADVDDPDTDHMDSSEGSTAQAKKEEKDSYRNAIKEDILMRFNNGDIDNTTFNRMMNELGFDIKPQEPSPEPQQKELAKAQMDARKREMQLTYINLNG